MKRQFDKQEKELTERNTKRNREQLSRLKEDIKYTKDFVHLKKKWKEYNLQRKQEEEEILINNLDKSIEAMKSKIGMLQENIKVSEDQLKNGVEIKIPKLVN